MTDREKVISNFEHEVNKAHGEGWDFVDLSTEDAKEILALLKEQEPRVLSPEELQNADFAYIEDGNRNLPIVPVLITDVNVLNLHYLIEDRLNDNESYLPLECYGKLWRCWTARPTDEQRKATPWDEPLKEE